MLLLTAAADDEGSMEPRVNGLVPTLSDGLQNSQSLSSSTDRKPSCTSDSYKIIIIIITIVYN